MKRITQSLTLILMFFVLVASGMQFISLGRANPYIKLPGKSVPSDINTKPPSISIASPENNSRHSKNGFLLTLNVSVGESTTASQPFLTRIYYEADWESNVTSVYEYIPDASIYPSPTISAIQTTIQLKEIPDGNHNITIYTNEVGSYTRTESQFMYLDGFSINGSASILFTVDTIPPNIFVITTRNATYNTPDIPLNFTTNEATSQISYVLDGRANVTIIGNTTLTGLSYGQHNVTVYVVDLAGNFGSSETMNFTVARQESFPTTELIIASGVSVPLIGVGLLFYFRKRQKQDKATKHD